MNNTARAYSNYDQNDKKSFSVLKPEIFSPSQKDKILQGIFKYSNMDASFLYIGQLGKLYQQVAQNPEYRPYVAEMEALHTYRRDIRKYIKSSITDVGCGDGAKDIALLGD
jgi:uncharacterized SAM-dependent methyltransferase